MSDEMIDTLAKAFCEASGVVVWEITPETMRAWYRQGIRAVVAEMKYSLNIHTPDGAIILDFLSKI